jgi:class 3 adenylate cyclase
VSGPTPEQLQAAGLYDPDDPLAAERLELVDYLVGLGATIDDMVTAWPGLPGLAAQIALRGSGERFTPAEAAERAGVAFETARRIWHAAGFPSPESGAKVCTDDDVETLRVFDAATHLLGEDVLLQIVRVIGTSMARIADATVGAFLTTVAGPSLVDDPGGLQLAKANTEAIELLRQAAGPMDAIFRRHFELFQRPLGADAGGTQELAVGFVDLVGSTALAQQLSVVELGRLLAEFDELVSDVVVLRGGRVVKLIGDEVMFVVADPATCCDIARELLRRLRAHERLPDGRGGLACGAVLSRDGDYFGSVVNLAARVVKLAAPGEVLVTTGVRDAVPDGAFTAIGAREVKGFGDPVELFALAGD